MYRSSHLRKNVVILWSHVLDLILFIQFFIESRLCLSFLCLRDEPYGFLYYLRLSNIVYLFTLPMECLFFRNHLLFNIGSILYLNSIGICLPTLRSFHLCSRVRCRSIGNICIIIFTEISK